MIQELFETVTRSLDQKGIAYMVSGSLALNVYCIPRMTMDIDIVLDDIPVWMVSAEDLIISKIEWIQQLESDKQIRDINMLMTIPEIDKEYITSWCKKLKLKTFDLL
jgi:hypothetical protein